MDLLRVTSTLSRNMLSRPGHKTWPEQKRCQRSLPFGRRIACCGSAHNAEHFQQSFHGLTVQRLRADVSGVVLRRAPLSFEQPVLKRALVPQISRGQMADSPATSSVQHWTWPRRCRF